MAAYARQAVARDGSAWSISNGVATLNANATFPTPASGSGTVTHAGLGTASSGAGNLIVKGAVTPNISWSSSNAPQLTTGTQFSQSTGDAMTTAAGTNLLALLLNNTAWANVGNAGGLQPSTVAGSLYLSLHSADPGESGDQTTNEISYT